MSKKLIVSLCLALVLGTGATTVAAAENEKFPTPTTPLTEQSAISTMIFQQDGASVKLSTDNGKTWKTYTPVKDHDFFTYDEFAEWIAVESKKIQKLVEAGEWTKEQADKVIASYNTVLSEISSGLQVSKRSSCDTEQIFFSMPDITQENIYQTAVYDGKTFEMFGPFETKQELYQALKDYTEKQIALGKMSVEEADELIIQKYN